MKMNLKCFVWIVACCGILNIPELAAQSADRYTLEKLMGETEAFFENTTAEQFLDRKDFERCRRFRWISDKQTDARYPGYGNTPPGLTFQGFACEEVIFRFKEGKMDSVYISYYNRGDAGVLPQNVFQEKLDSMTKTFNDLTGSESALQKGKLASKAEIQQRVWVKGALAYLLKWSFTSLSRKIFVPEYIQLEIRKFDPKDDPRKQSVTTADRSEMKRGKALTSNIVKSPDGSVYIDNIPMVDQGHKGYCAVAVMERLMKYYGNEDVTQHTIAQIAATSEGGTSLTAMLEAMKKAGTKLGVKVRERYIGAKTVKDLEKFLTKYNSAARKSKKPKVELVIRNNAVYLEETMKQMDRDIWKNVKLNEKSDYRKFLAVLHESVAKGIPVAWCVSLGIVPEPGIPQNAGGHMRLLIGYNDKEKKVYFSDTWGAGHEKKEMTMDDAWLITDAALTVDPRK